MKKTISIFVAMSIFAICTIFAFALSDDTPAIDTNAKKVTKKSTLALNKKELVITKGKTYQLKVKGNYKKVKWSSKNKKVATISKKGKVVAKKKGTTTLVAKVTYKNNIKKTLKCKVIVEVPKLTSKELTLYVGATTMFPLSGTKRTPKFSSSNKKVATIDKNGKIVAKKKGTTTINAKLNGKNYKCSVVVKKDENPTLSDTTIIMHKGEVVELIVNGTNEDAIFSSDNSQIASVDSYYGLISGEDCGKTTITAKVCGKTLTCVVYVVATLAGEEWLTNPTKYGDFRVQAQQMYNEHEKYFQNHLDWINNGARALTNSPPLELDETLSLIACYRAYECIYGETRYENGSHYYPDGIGAPFFVSCGLYNYYTCAAEVLATTNGTEDISASYVQFDKNGRKFYKSEAHTKRIQSTEHTKVGVGIAYGNGKCVLVYVFD